MKELSIEEKAKAYDESKARMSRAFNSNRCSFGFMNEIFPELKESEDERIRKEILSFLKEGKPYYGPNSAKRQEWAAWFENQCKNNMGISEATKQKLEESLNNALAVETGESLNEFLDEQKPDDKVEPKFKVGDWVVYDGWICQIVDVTEDGYCNSQHGFIPKNREDSMRLWTIQDAKDGDVLTSDYEGGICIALLKNVLSISEIEMYCHLINNDLFIPKSGYSNATWHPATKEQRDLLFQKMYEAGYEWDAEKKELKKIEQKPVIEIKTPEESLGISSDDYKKIVDECIYGDDKPAWSEEDEVFVHGLIRGLSAKRDIHGHTTFSSDCIDITETINWLKSIKNRVQPQPRQEWSEEDEGYYDAIIAKLEVTQEDALLTDNEMDFLKSLKERVLPESTWNEEDKTKIKSIIALLKSPALCTMDGNKGIIDESIKYLKSLKDRVLPQPKKEWSKEDKAKIILLESLCDSYEAEFIDSEYSSIRTEILKTRDWLESLKDRILPQSKQEWNEEDSPYYDDICEILINLLYSETADVNKDAVQKDLDWLNSLKDRVQPQNRWKPSDEQMEALRQAAYEPEKNWSKELQSLYCDLKKLREE